MQFIRYIICCLLSSVALNCDTASVFSGTGGMIKVLPNKHLQMLHEKISIHVKESFTEFEIIYTFYNNSNSSKNISMGFPQRKGNIESKLFHFEAFDGNNPLETFFHLSPYQDEFDWYLYDVEFAPNETKTLKNSYWVYPTNYRGLYSLEYILHTGSSWMDVIKEVEIEVFLDEPFVFSPNQLSLNGLEIKPHGYKINKSNNLLSWNFKNLNPSKKDDLSILFIRNGILFGTRSDTASSTLTIDDLYGEYFGTENVLDGDLSTAWGSEKNSIGEWIRIDFDKPLQNISKIGVFPGIAPDERFVNYNHIKKATLIFSDGSIKEINFIEKPKMHFFNIDKKNINWVQLRVDEIYTGLFQQDIYKNSIYISEIHFFD